MDIVVEREGADDTIVTLERNATVYALCDAVCTAARDAFEMHEFALLHEGGVLADPAANDSGSCGEMDRMLDGVGVGSGSRVEMRVHGHVLAARKLRQLYGVEASTAALLKAMERRQWGAVRCLLACRGVSHADALLHAVGVNQVGDVAALLDAGADACAVDAKGWSSLLSAAAHGHTDTLRLLLSHGVDPDAKHDLGQTALMAATTGGHEACVALLLEKGACVNAADDGGWTALLSAMADRQCECGQALLRHGADPNLRNHTGSSALLFAAGQGCGERIVSELLAAGGDPNTSDNDGRTPLMAAAECDDVDVVTALLAHGADANAEDSCGRTPIRLAAENRRSRCGRVLLAHGADPAHKDVEGTSALMVAMDNDDYALAKVFVAHGKDSAITLESADQMTFTDDSVLRRFLDTMASDEPHDGAEARGL